MIKVYYKWKLYKTYIKAELKNMKDVKMIYDKLFKKWLLKIENNSDLEVEEPMQYILRKNFYNLSSY
jgi:hypothetical protein